VIHAGLSSQWLWLDRRSGEACRCRRSRPAAASKAAGASYRWFFTEPSGDQLREIARLVDSGAVKPVIDREFAFTELPAALAYLEKGRARGKVVLKVK
jgi:alcohol dehydrogenase